MQSNKRPRREFESEEIFDGETEREQDVTLQALTSSHPSLR